MSLRTHLLMFAVGLALALGCVSSVSSRTQEPPFQFAQTEQLTLDWETLHETVTIELLNNTNQPLNLILQLQDSKNLQDEQQGLSVVAQLSATNVTLPASNSVTVTLGAQENVEVVASTYLGYFIASDAASGTVLRRLVQVTVPESTAQEQVPLVQTWPMTVTRIFPLLNLGRQTTTLPLSDTGSGMTSSCPAPGVTATPGVTASPEPSASSEASTAPSITASPEPTASPLGVLTNGKGNVAIVSAGGMNSWHSGSYTGACGLELRIDGLDQAGIYEGTIGLTPADSEDPTTLSVTVRDCFIWPLLVLALGVVLAQWPSHYFGVRRNILNLRLREARLDTTYMQAKQWVEQERHGKKDLFTGYTIEADLNKSRREIRDALGRLGPFPILDEYTETTTKAKEQLGRIENQLQDWQQLATDLKVLSQTATKIETRATTVAGQLPPQPNGQPITNPPVFVAVACALLTGQDLQLSDIAERRQTIDDEVSYTNAWYATADKALRVWNMIQRHAGASPPTTEPTEPELAEHWRNVQGFLRMLWCEELSIEQINNIDKKLDDILPELYSSPVRAATYMADDTKVESGGGDPPLSSEPGRARRIWNWIKAQDRATFMLALVVALLTGLNELYLGNPFGTGQDYLNAFLWGFGTKIAIDAVTLVLNQFWGSKAA